MLKKRKRLAAADAAVEAAAEARVVANQELIAAVDRSGVSSAEIKALAAALAGHGPAAAGAEATLGALLSAQDKMVADAQAERTHLGYTALMEMDSKIAVQLAAAQVELAKAVLSRATVLEPQAKQTVLLLTLRVVRDVLAT